MTIVETERLRLRKFALEDAGFILRLVNEPSWIEFIGDKHVRDLEDARNYLRYGPLDMYERYGLGLYMVERKSDGAGIGTCGLMKRDSLPDFDIGYALLPEFWGQGYASEAASAVLEHAHRTLDLARILAITSPRNARSIRVLEKVGMRFERMAKVSEDNEVPIIRRGSALSRSLTSSSRSTAPLLAGSSIRHLGSDCRT